jgi:hypothetical protein
MKDILNNISTLEGFMTNEQVTSCILTADAMGCNPVQVAPYNGPEHPEDPEHPENPGRFQRV